MPQKKIKIEFSEMDLKEILCKVYNIKLDSATFSVSKTEHDRMPGTYVTDAILEGIEKENVS